MKRIGHKGAHLIEAGNTLASFEVARAIGVDMIEFDVLRHDGRLVIAHDPHDAIERDGGSLMTLEAGLDHLATADYDEIGLDVDMKHRGFELELADALARRGLIERTTITTMHESSLALIRAHDPEVRIGLTIPFVTRDWLSAPAIVRPLLAGGILYHRLRQPARVERMLLAGEIDAVMAFHAVVTKRLVDVVHRAGGELFSWTVDDERTIMRLADLGVDGIVSNDPRLFESLREAVAATA
ncbi:MAG: glycerophosphodiester phosphodiesterase [Solirubrobacterales bacterium]